MLELSIKRMLPIVMVVFLVLVAAAVLGGSVGVEPEAFGSPAQSAMLVVVLGLIVVVGYVGYRFFAAK